MRRTSILLILLLLLSSFSLMPGSYVLGKDTSSRSTVYTTDFEDGEGNWTHDGAGDEWELGDPSDGPGYCHSSLNCWGTDLYDSYEADANAYLESPMIDLENAHSAFIEYYQWYDISNFIGIFTDNAYVEISDNNGVNYTPVINFTGTSSEADWHNIIVDLDDYVGEQITVRFRLYSDGIFEDSGWFIDDFTVKMDETPKLNDTHDLAVSKIKIDPSSPDVGVDTYFRVVVENLGDFEEASYKASLKIADAKTSDVVYLDYKTGSDLKQGSSVELTFLWSPEYAGKFLLEAQVYSTIDQNSDNNIKVGRIMVGNPHDVSITDLSIKPSTPAPDVLATISVVVENIGDYEEAGIGVDLVAMDDMDNVLLEDSQTIDLLKVGARNTLDFKWTPKASGTFNILANAKLPQDSNLSNNNANMSIEIPNIGVDMTVEKASADPSGSGPGEERDVSTKVKNIGEIGATNIKVSYVITRSTTVVAEGSADVDYLGPGEAKKVNWKFTPSTEGTYIFTVTVTAEDDPNTDNNELSIVFVVPKVIHDVGIESLSVLPRTGDKGVERSILAKVSNYGDREETFMVTISITDPFGTTVLAKEFNLTIEPDNVKVVETNFTATTYGNHTLTAETSLAKDDVPANDVATTSFIVNYHVVHDIGLDSLSVLPVMGNASMRVFSVDVMNLGTETETFRIHFELYLENGVPFDNFTSSNNTYDQASSGSVGFSTPINETGNLSVTASVVIPIDDLAENDMLRTYFWIVEPMTHDVGVAILGVYPRTSDLIERNIYVHIGNFGTTPETDIPLYVTMNLSSKVEVLYDGVVSGTIDPGNSTSLLINWTPMEFGTYLLMADTNLTNDEFPANDVMSVEVFALMPLYYDLGIEDLNIDPRTDLEGVQRQIKVSITNYGDSAVDGYLQVTVRDDADAIVQRANRSMLLSTGVNMIVSVNFTPEHPGRYGVEAVISLLGSIGDMEPANDRLDMSFFSIKAPPKIDVSIESVIVRPIPIQTGKDIDIVATLRNVGTEPANGVATFTISDPNGRKTVWDQDFSFKKGNNLHEVIFTMNPVLAGIHNVSVKVVVQFDENASNDRYGTTFEAIGVGDRDAAVSALNVEAAGSCSMTFKVRANIKNQGTGAIGGVKVHLKVTGEGEDFDQERTIYLPKGGSVPVVFNFSAPVVAGYKFVVTVVADGDEDPSNDMGSKWSNSCDPSSSGAHTTVDPPFPWWLILSIIAIVAIVSYNYIRYGKKAQARGYRSRPDRDPVAKGGNWTYGRQS